MRRVMISYSTRQRDIANRFECWLKTEGHSPKLDHLDIGVGDRFAKTLASWLSACHVAVVLVSEDALVSPWVRYELSVLVNRQREGRDVRVVLILLDGLDLKTVAARPELSPLELGALQARAWSGPVTSLTDAAIEQLLDGALDDTTDAPIEALVGVAHDGLDAAGDAAVARARKTLSQHVGSDPDPWRDDPTVGDAGPLRWALARDLCSYALGIVYHGLAVLADDPRMGREVAALVDLNVMAAFDVTALRTLRDAWVASGPPDVVVLGFTTEVVARLAAEAVHLVHQTPVPFPKPILSPLTGANVDEVVDGIVSELEASLGEDEIPLDQYIEELAADGHPVVLLLTRPEGLNSEILGRLRHRLARVAIVVLASPSAGPESWSARLVGARLAGPRLDGSAWGQLVAMEAALVAERGQKMKNLRRVIQQAAR